MKTKFPIKPDPAPPSAVVPADSTQTVALSSGAARSPLTLKQILVPVDFSLCSLKALDYALGLAQTFQAKLTLLHVVEPTVYPESYALTPSTLDEANQNLMESSRERLSELKRRPAMHGLSIQILVRMGRAQSEIPDTAKATASDMIVMGTHGHTGLKHVFLGGTAERVVRNASCPVLLIRES
jgi:universal stress protein A